MRKLLFLVVLLLGVLPTVAQAQESETALFTYLYDLDATSTTYCKLTGANGVFRPGMNWRKGRNHLKTAGSSTTVTDNTSGDNVFNDISAGDVISANGATRYVVSKTDATTVVVDSAVDWSSGYSFQWLKLECGTTATDGWLDVANFDNRTIIFQLEQANVDTNGIDVSWECKTNYIGAQPVQVFPDNSSAAAVTNFLEGVAGTLEGRKAINIPEPWSACRVGILINTADDGDDTGANLEQITIGFVGLRDR